MKNMQNKQEKQKQEQKQTRTQTQFSSNAIWLSVWEWLIAAGIIVVIAFILPPVWRNAEQLSFQVRFLAKDHP